MNRETLVNESSNSFRPLRQPGPLPSEILTEILLLSLPPLPGCQAPQMEALSLVCRFWHLIVESTPALWSRISIADDISHVRKAISRSGEHVIDVRGENAAPRSDWLDAGDEGGSSMFLATVQPHAWRWRHVALEVPPPERSTSTFTILPSLQTLKFYSWDDFFLSDQLLALLNRQHVPQLREVFVSSVRIARWDLISLPPTLSKLEISHIFRDYPFIVGWLSAIAAGCPNLAVLRLCNTWTAPGDGVKSNENCVAPVILELNALRKLDLDQVRSCLIIDLLKRFRLPEDCAVSIGCRLESSTPSTSFLSPALSSQSNFQRAGKPRQVTVALAGSDKYVLVAYQRWRIYLDLPGAWAIRDALEWFGVRGADSSSPSSHPEGLQVGLATSNVPPVTLQFRRAWLHRNFHQLRAISDLRNINRIEMNSLSEKERRALLVYLSAPEDPNQPPRAMADFLSMGPEPESKQEVTGVWPFPGLSELVRRESKDDVVHRVLMEPITGQCSDDGAAARSARATRSELPEPNTPWEKME